jgi:hypothetical protein
MRKHAVAGLALAMMALIPLAAEAGERRSADRGRAEAIEACVGINEYAPAKADRDGAPERLRWRGNSAPLASRCRPSIIASPEAVVDLIRLIKAAGKPPTLSSAGAPAK